jgi:hypothetical protein
MARLVGKLTDGTKSHLTLTTCCRHERVPVVDLIPEKNAQYMADKSRATVEPAWLNPANDRKTPFTAAELDLLASDFSAMNGDTAAWRALVAEVGEQEAAAVVKQRLAAQDPRSLINWRPVGAKQ